MTHRHAGRSPIRIEATSRYPGTSPNRIEATCPTSIEVAKPHRGDLPVSRDLTEPHRGDPLHIDRGRETASRRPPGIPGCHEGASMRLRDLRGRPAPRIARVTRPTMGPRPPNRENRSAPTIVRNAWEPRADTALERWFP